jgi:hypothetical protein
LPDQGDVPGLLLDDDAEKSIAARGASLERIGFELGGAGTAAFASEAPAHCGGRLADERLVVAAIEDGRGQPVPAGPEVDPTGEIWSALTLAEVRVRRPEVDG